MKRWFGWFTCFLFISLSALSVVHAEKITLPDEDLKAFELVEVFEKLDHAYLGYGPVQSLRDSEYVYNEKSIFSFTADNTSIAPFLDTSFSQVADATANQTDVMSFVKTNTSIHTVTFNKKFERNFQTVTHVVYTIPEVTNTKNQLVHTLMRLPVSSEEITLLEGQAQIFDTQGDTIILHKGMATTVRFLIDGNINHSEILQTSFYTSKQKLNQKRNAEKKLQEELEATAAAEAAAKEQVEKERQEEQILAAKALEPKPFNWMLVVYPFIAILVLGALGGAGYGIVQFKQRRDILAHYAAPKSALNIEAEDHKETLPHAIVANAEDHLHSYYNEKSKKLLILGLVTLNIYALLWLFKSAKSLKEAGKRVMEPPLVFAWFFIGPGTVLYILYVVKYYQSVKQVRPNLSIITLILLILLPAVGVFLVNKAFENIETT